MKPVNLFKALADETRLRLINLLMNHELSVNEIVTIMNMGQSRISRHLKILTDSGLLTSRRDGLWIFYKADHDNGKFNFLRTIQDILNQNEELIKDLKVLQTNIERNAHEKIQFFNSLAQDWDGIKEGLIGIKDFSLEILKSIPVVETITDLGCGTGEMLLLLKEKATKIIGVDKSPEMLLKAKERIDKDDSIELRIGEVEHLPMRDYETDAVLINMVLHHLNNPQVCIEESARVLKSNGKCIIVDFAKHNDESFREKYDHRWLGFSQKEIEKWLQTVKMNIIKINRIKLKNDVSIQIIVSKKGQ